MNYVDAATTNILSPGILPVEDLTNMLRHIESELPSTMHLPIPSDDTLHFYQYLSTQVLIAEEQFLLLIHVPIKTEHKGFKYKKLSVHQFHIVTYKPSIKLATGT